MDGLEHEQLMQFYKYSIEKEVELVWWRDAGGISENSGVNLCTYSIYIYIYMCTIFKSQNQQILCVNELQTNSLSSHHLSS